MRFHFAWVGKTRNEHLRALVDEYLKRLSRFVRCGVTELRESARSDPRLCLVDEGKRITALFASEALVVLLDIEGRQWSSPELAVEVERWQASPAKEVAFVVGGHLGVAPEVKKRADVRWSLSSLTLTHEMARVVLVEQLYRATTILRGEPYHK